MLGFTDWPCFAPAFDCPAAGTKDRNRVIIEHSLSKAQAADMKKAARKKKQGFSQARYLERSKERKKEWKSSLFQARELGVVAKRKRGGNHAHLLEASALGAPGSNGETGKSVTNDGADL